TGARRARYLEVFRPLQMRNLLWDERLSARAGLAFADPWSDRRLAEFVLAVPPWVVQRMSEPKRLARMALRYVIPANALGRVAKVSPAALYRRGVHDRARPTIERILEGSLADRRGFVDATALRWHYDALVAGEQREIPTLRSEERRVGKECRSRWWAEQEETNGRDQRTTYGRLEAC